MNNDYKKAAIWFGLGVVLAIVLTGEPEGATAAKADRSQYCQMIELYAATKGEYGWPPYKGGCDD